MGKSIGNNVLDAALQHLEDNGQTFVLCDGEPTTYANATTDKPTGNALGETTITATDFTGPADGDTNGRKTQVNAQTAITVDVTGTLDHIAIVDDSNTALLLVTTVSNSQSVTASNTVDTTAFDVEIADPT
jgi:hypothetical protein